jgi:putative endonuclease
MPVSADRTGHRAELAARWLLRLKGFKVLARRFKSPAGEIDLVGLRGDLLVFVEVKARAGHLLALQSLTARQRRRIARAAEHFLKLRPDLRACRCRFDLVTWAPWHLPRHLPDAWRL